MLGSDGGGGDGGSSGGVCNEFNFQSKGTTTSNEEVNNGWMNEW